MQTCSKVIKRALVRLGVVGVQRTPSDAQAAAGLEALRSFYSHLVTSGALGRATPVRVTEDYTACERDWISYETADAVTVTIPGDFEVCCSTAYDTERFCGCATNYSTIRAPKDLTFVGFTDGVSTAIWLYDMYDGLWTSVQALALTDNAPLSTRDYEGLACALAMDMADDYGVEPGALTMRRAAAFRASLGRRDGSPATQTSYEYF